MVAAQTWTVPIAESNRQANVEAKQKLEETDAAVMFGIGIASRRGPWKVHSGLLKCQEAARATHFVSRKLYFRNVVYNTGLWDKIVTLITWEEREAGKA